MKRLILIGLLLVGSLFLTSCSMLESDFFCTGTKYEVRTMDDKFVDNCVNFATMNRRYFGCDKGYNIDGSNLKHKIFEYNTCEED